jgi:hypothetical protein
MPVQYYLSIKTAVEEAHGPHTLDTLHWREQMREVVDARGTGRRTGRRRRARRGGSVNVKVLRLLQLLVSISRWTRAIAFDGDDDAAMRAAADLAAATIWAIDREEVHGSFEHFRALLRKRARSLPRPPARRGGRGGR